MSEVKCKNCKDVIRAMVADKAFAELCEGIGEEPQWLKDARVLLEQPTRAVEVSGRWWLAMETAPLDGTRILVDFGSVGVHSVSWDEACNGNTGWVVDDRKHGPYSLRGYVESEVQGWMPLPAGKGETR